MSTVVSRHLADAVLFDFAFDAPSTALEDDAGLEEFIKRNLLEVVDEVFSAVVVDDQILQVSQLEVDLGVVNYADYQEALPQKLRDRLTTALHEIYLAAQRHPTPHRRLSSRRHSEYELIEYFLEKGRLPWSAMVNAAELTRLASCSPGAAVSRNSALLTVAAVSARGSIRHGSAVAGVKRALEGVRCGGYLLCLPCDNDRTVDATGVGEATGAVITPERRPRPATPAYGGITAGVCTTLGQ
ncbi:MAG: hypothetical protein FD130_2596 [Halothiobacillaceae bacterium]|nr:MAG: hypothetical protein FD130_2596 [Halothiobacillaceae bacterium]